MGASVGGFTLSTTDLKIPGAWIYPSSGPRCWLPTPDAHRLPPLRDLIAAHDPAHDPTTRKSDFLLNRALASSFELTPRQLEIVKAIFDDKSESAIAAELGVTYNTVHTHVRRLYMKLEVRSRSGVIMRFLFMCGDFE